MSVSDRLGLMPPKITTGPIKSPTVQPPRGRFLAKKWLVLGGLIVLIITGGGLYLWKARSTARLSTSGGQQAQIKLAQLVVWDDPAGFTFEYPQDLKVDKHDEDKENYAHVELTSPGRQGRVIVWAKDLPLKAAESP